MDATATEVQVDSDRLGSTTIIKCPQAIGHRGYNARYPENTLCSFKAAVEVGAHGLETDVHISKDGIVVLSHDSTLKRCFGVDKKIIDCDWSYLSTLKTLKEPHDSMPRLVDLLSYLDSPGVEHVWLLLDIKVDNNRDDILRLISLEVLRTPHSSRPWSSRIILGVWAAEYVPLCEHYLPGFRIAFIGFDIFYARRFLGDRRITFNLMQPMLVGPFGQRFLRDARKNNQAVYVWTVNRPISMRWSIRKQLDGVLTDDPAKFLEVCREYDEAPEPASSIMWEYLNMAGIGAVAAFFAFFFRWRYGFRL